MLPIKGFGLRPLFIRGYKGPRGAILGLQRALWGYVFVLVLKWSWGTMLVPKGFLVLYFGAKKKVLGAIFLC